MGALGRGMVTARGAGTHDDDATNEQGRHYPEAEAAGVRCRLPSTLRCVPPSHQPRAWQAELALVLLYVLLGQGVATTAPASATNEPSGAASHAVAPLARAK